MKVLQVGKHLKISIPIAIYTILSHFMADMVANPAIGRSEIYVAQLGAWALLTCLYLGNFKQLAQGQYRWQWGMAIAFMAPLLTMSVMQTDQLRYIWDGLNTVRGSNPYQWPPAAMPAFKQIWWVGMINHPQLPTIYPPGSQLIFALGAILNPFFWFSGEGWAYHPHVATLWQVEFGHSILVGIALAGMVFVMRRGNWAIIICNPLTIICLFGNKHLDAFLLPLLAIILSTNLLIRKTNLHGSLVAIAASIKWLPLIWLPFLLGFLQRQTRKSLVLFNYGLYLLATLVLLCSIFMPYFMMGAKASSAAFAEHWYFFGFVFQWLSWLQESLGYSGYSIATRFMVVGLGAIWLIYLLLVFTQRHLRRPSLRLILIWLMIGFYALFPTLHPWYLAPLLIVGAKHYKSIWTPWLWPALAFVSQSYYLADAIIIPIYIGHYSVIFAAICHDLYRCRHYLFGKTFTRNIRIPALENRGAHHA